MSLDAESLTDVVIINGPPGAGKGFLSGHYVAENLTAQHISAGDLIRGIRSGDIDSEYSDTVLDCLESRSYLPDAVFGGVVLERVTKGHGTTDLSLLDAFPYGAGDFEYVKEGLILSKKRILGAISLEATLDTCVSRMVYRGLRGGEAVRKSVISSEEVSEEEYFKKRYDSYGLAHDLLLDILNRQNVIVKTIDVNSDILAEETRVEALASFTEAITSLKSDN